ncbi:MAG: hypothetical protein HRU22_14035 [Gammaproteobacteria bacterium]|nr:hypothetical protein [Gammaproteobacteria bacterium]
MPDIQMLGQSIQPEVRGIYRMRNLILIASVASFVTLLFFVSLLGENHRINDLIKEHFIKLKAEDYSAKCIPISIGSIILEHQNQQVCDTQNFLLSLSLLKKFDLLAAKDYNVNIKRDNFWIPYFSNGTVTVSLKLQNTSEQDYFSFNSQFEDAYVKELFIVKRKNWRWVIDQVNLNEPTLVEIFNDFQKTLNFDKYIEKTTEGYNFHDISIESQKLTGLDKRLLRFNLQKVAELLD